MTDEAVSHGVDLIPVVTLLAAGVVAVPLFKRIGLDSVLGYLAAGLVIGPFGLGLFSDADSILQVAELGVVMFLFVIGLEMRPSRLWGLRREILGLGLLQVVTCGTLLTAAGVQLGYPPVVAFVFAMGFVLTSTAIVFQVLNERGELSMAKGQRIVSVLLLEDMAIVPLLAFVAFMAPGGSETGWQVQLLQIAIGLGAVTTLILVGRYLFNPLFNILAGANAREVMTAAALLVVLGAALLMQLSGLSMAMGAFLAGVLLSESAFRHQLEADIEPFRGILLGLFFLGVGMSLDLDIVVSNLASILSAVVTFMLLKALGIYLVARLLKANNREGLERAALMAQGGEFAFVLYAAATAVGLIDGATSAIFTSAVILSMVLTPFVVMIVSRVLPEPKPSLEGIDRPDGLTGSVLLIGFGRFGQMVSQPLLARGIKVSVIDTDVEMIQVAQEAFGFKVYYGDGSRLDILHAAGAGQAKTVMVCVDQPATARHIAELVKSEFPLVQVMARAYDRRAALSLLDTGVDYQIRETVESAFAFGRAALTRLGVPEQEADAIILDVRRRDVQRFEAQIAEGILAGSEYVPGYQATPAPLSTPQETGAAGNDETRAAITAARKAKSPTSTTSN